MSGRSSSDAILLAAGLEELGLPLDPARQSTLLELLRLVYVWNRSAGLTRIEPADAVRLHLLDSLLALPLLHGERAVDLGSGGGFPGLPLAIARPDLSWTLVESNRRRCSFLLEAARALGLGNVVVREGDAGSATAAFPTVISRAFRHPPEFLQIARAWVAPAGRILVMMAEADDAALVELGRSANLAWIEARRWVLPGGGEPRIVAAFAAP